MDRRHFMSVMGAFAATAGAAAGVAGFGRDIAAAKSRAAGLAQAAGMPAAAGETLFAPDTRWVDLAFIPEAAIPAPRTAAPRTGARSAPLASGDVYYAVRLAGLRRARPSPALQHIDVVARFAIDEAPHTATFLAWSHAEGTPSRTSAPVAFAAAAPDRAALDIRYVLAPGVAGPNATSGSLYLPIGGGGLAPGIYAMTTPSASTGAMPDLRDFRYSGDSRAPLTVRRGVALDFDHFVFAIHTHRR
jgi:hypothetical protein